MVAVAGLCGLSGVAPAAAVVCSSSTVVAAGQAEYFRFAAASQARAAWTGKVGRSRKLGTAYRHWSLANDSRVTCRRAGGRYRCVALGDPCRSGTAGPWQITRRGPA